MDHYYRFQSGGYGAAWQGYDAYGNGNYGPSYNATQSYGYQGMDTQSLDPAASYRGTYPAAAIGASGAYNGAYPAYGAEVVEEEYQEGPYADGQQTYLANGYYSQVPAAAAAPRTRTSAPAGGGAGPSSRPNGASTSGAGRGSTSAGSGSAGPSSGASRAVPPHGGRAREGALFTRAAVEQMAGCAPLWVVYPNYGAAMPGPSQAPRVLTTNQLLALHQERKLQGHTLLAGIAANAASRAANLHPSFLRPVVYILAMLRAGLSYVPTSLDDVAAGRPALGWCVPGSLFQPAPEGPGPANVVAWSLERPSECIQRLLGLAPHWAHLATYSEYGRWHCPQNLTRDQMRQRLHAGTLDLYSCVMGCSETLPPGVWIPTSMVLPLGALLAILSSAPGRAALRYVVPSRADVHYYVEDAVRAVLGRPAMQQALGLHLAALPAPAATAPAAAGSAPRLDPGAQSFAPPGVGGAGARAPAAAAGPQAAAAASAAAAAAPAATAAAAAGSSTAASTGRKQQAVNGGRAAAAATAAKPAASAGAPSSAAGTAAPAAGAPEAAAGPSGSSGVAAPAAQDASAAPAPGAAPVAPGKPDGKQATQSGRAMEEVEGRDSAQPSAKRRLQAAAAAAPDLSPAPGAATEPAAQEQPAAGPDPSAGSGDARASAGPGEGEGLAAAGDGRAVAAAMDMDASGAAQAAQVPMPIPMPVMRAEAEEEKEAQAADVGTAAQQPMEFEMEQQQQQQSRGGAPAGAGPGPGCGAPQPAAVDTLPQAASPGGSGALVPIQPPFLRFETAVFRLFQGDHGQHAFSSLWWYLDPSTTHAVVGGVAMPRVRGPFSCEQMILAYIAQLLNNDVMVCGTLSTLSSPVAPRHANFKRLGLLMACMEEGQSYQLLRMAPELLPVTPALQLLQQQAQAQAAAVAAGALRPVAPPPSQPQMPALAGRPMGHPVEMAVATAAARASVLITEQQQVAGGAVAWPNRGPPPAPSMEDFPPLGAAMNMGRGAGR